MDEKSQQGRRGIKNASSQTAFVSAGGCDEEVEDEEDEEGEEEEEGEEGAARQPGEATRLLAR